MRLRERIRDRRIRRKKRRGEQASTPRGRRLDASSTVKVEKEAPAFTKVERQPKSNVKPPKSDMKTDMSEGRSNVSADKGTGTGLPRTIGEARKQAKKKGTMAKTFMSKSGKAKAAVTREDMQKVGLDPNKKSDLTKYLNKRNKLGRKPKKSDFAPAKRLGKSDAPTRMYAKAGGGMMKAKGMKAGGKMKTKGMKAGGKMKTKGRANGGMMKAKGKAGGGMMKTKGRTAGGKMKTKGMKAGGKFPDLNKDGSITKADILKGRGVPGMKGGGMKTKGYMAGGKMKAKGYAVGGKMKAKGSAAGGKKGKQKVRGAGIARKGVRPAKMY